MDVLNFTIPKLTELIRPSRFMDTSRWNQSWTHRSEWKDLQLSVLAGACSPIVSSASRTWRWRQIVHPQTQALLDQKQPMILAIWHGRIFGMLCGFDPKTLSIMVSPSNDGEFITRLAYRLGFRHFIRGSVKRGGSQAVRKIIRTVQQKQRSVLITVDGPRGPRERLKPNIIRIASQAQVPIVPVVPACGWMFWHMRQSWDHFVAPQFFTPMTIHMGEPFIIPAELPDEATVETERLRVETVMRSMTEEADQYFQSFRWV